MSEEKVYRFDTQEAVDARLLELLESQESSAAAFLQVLAKCGNGVDAKYVVEQAKKIHPICKIEHLNILKSEMNHNKSKHVNGLKDAFNRAVERGDVRPGLQMLRFATVSRAKTVSQSVDM